MDFETIVVGGGIAGMSCALRLKEQGRDVAIITDELGGRVNYDKDLDSNFGAVFFMENYTLSKKIIDSKGPLVAKLNNLKLHSTPSKVFKGNSLTMILSLPQLLKFQRFMKNDFMPEYARYKKDCETMPVAEAFKKYPNLSRYFHMRASDLIKELGIDKVCDNFVSKFAYACTGSKIDELNALDFLNVTQGVIIPLYDFSFDGESFTRKLDGKVILDTITAVEREGDLWKVASAGGSSWACKYLVVATTGLVTQKLLGIEEIRQPTRLVSTLLEGKPKNVLDGADAHYFSDRFDIIATNKRSDGRFNVYSRTQIDYGEYFDDAKVLHSRDWPEALFTYGDVIQVQDFDENLWIAGDINGLGLEPAAISGVYAANRILGVC